jgi:hypothetical protein
MWWCKASYMCPTDNQIRSPNDVFILDNLSSNVYLEDNDIRQSIETILSQIAHLDDPATRFFFKERKVVIIAHMN